MPEAITSTLIVNIALAALILEIVALSLYHVRTKRGLPLRAILMISVPGLFLMLAIKAALSDAAPQYLALLLALSLIAHLSDLYARWHRNPSPD